MRCPETSKHNVGNQYSFPMPNCLVTQPKQGYNSKGHKYYCTAIKSMIEQFP